MDIIGLIEERGIIFLWILIIILIPLWILFLIDYIRLKDDKSSIIFDEDGSLTAFIIFLFLSIIILGLIVYYYVYSKKNRVSPAGVPAPTEEYSSYGDSDETALSPDQQLVEDALRNLDSTPSIKDLKPNF